jgi:hypothetical protein
MLCQDIRERQFSDDAVRKVGKSKSVCLLSKTRYFFVASDIPDSGLIPIKIVAFEVLLTFSTV